MPSRSTYTEYANDILVASAARTTNSDSGFYDGFGPAQSLMCYFECTARSGTTPTLDVAVEHSLDGGTTWLHLTRFTQVVAGTTLTFRELMEVSPQLATAASASVTVVSGGTAFNRGAQQANFGDQLRVRWVIGGTATPTFTFSVRVVSQSPKT